MGVGTWSKKGPKHPYVISEQPLVIDPYCLFVCLGGRQGEADELNCNPLQRVGIPFFRDLASRP